MRPKEIQEKLGIDAYRIKLFKREGIFFPEYVALNPVKDKELEEIIKQNI